MGKKTYKTIEAESIEELDKKVSEHLSSGFELAGSAYAATQTTHHSNGNGFQWYEHKIIHYRPVIWDK